MSRPVTPVPILKEDVMDIKELTELLVTSSESFNQTKFIPWWEGDHENAIYAYDMLPVETVQEADACITACGKEELLSPVGRLGLTLFHLLVWHNFYEAVKKLLLNEETAADAVNLPDHKGHGLTPLLLACSRGNLAMVKLLLEHGADDSHSDARGMNAFHFLAYPRFEGLAINFTCLEQSVEQRGEIARLVSCDVNQKNKDGLSPLEQLLTSEYSSSYTWPLTEIFLEKGATTDYVDEGGNTLLMMARKNGHNTAALRLMEKCPELLEVPDQNGVTPLQHAIEYRNHAMYHALLGHGAKPVSDSSMNDFPLSQVTSNAFCNVSQSNKDALAVALYMTEKMILQIDPDDDDEIGEVTDIFHNALISDKEAHVLEICKSAGIDFTLPIHYHGDVFCLRDKCLRAAYGIGVIRKLAELGVDMDLAVINEQTPAYIVASLDGKDDSFFEEAAKIFSRESMEQTANGGKAAIHLAAENGHTAMLRVMVEKGLDVNLTQDEPGDAGATALHCACAFGHEDAVKLLMDAGADDTMKNLKGETPAHYALMKKRYGRGMEPEQKVGLLRLLKNLDLPREDGKTPLLLLDEVYDPQELLSLLVEKGVDVNHADNQGMTLLMLSPDKDTAKILLRAGADVNLADHQGNTALHYALENRSAGDARYLIKKGADYNRPNNQGVTPVQIAAEKGFDTVLELMTDIK